MNTKKQAQAIAEVRAICDRDSAAWQARIETEHAHARANDKRYHTIRPAKYPWRDCRKGMGTVIETGIGSARVLGGSSGWKDWITDHPSRVITLKTARHVWTIALTGSQLTRDTTWLDCQDIVEIGPTGAIFVNGAKSGHCGFRPLTLSEKQEQVLSDQLNPPPPSKKGNSKGRTPATRAEIDADKKLMAQWQAYCKKEADENGNRKPKYGPFAQQIGKTVKQVKWVIDRVRGREKARERVKV